MKNRLLVLLLSFVLVFTLAAPMAFAKTTTVKTTIKRLNNGCYYETVIKESLTKSAKTKTGSKTVYYKNAKDETLWYAKLTGTFTYTGSTAKCTGVTLSSKSYSTAWKVTNQSTTNSGRTASGTAVGKRYLTGVCVQTVNRTITLSCSNSGTLS